MATLNTHDALRDSLNNMETMLATPIMAGELTNWIGELLQSWELMSEQIHDQLSIEHPRQYQQISKEDPEMLPRIDKLKAEDQAIEDDSDNFNRLLARVAAHAPKFEPDEEKMRRHTVALIEAGDALVHRARKQEVAVQSWFVEAFNRDRGVAD